MKLYAVIGTITPGCGVYIHLYGPWRRCETEAGLGRPQRDRLRSGNPSNCDASLGWQGRNPPPSGGEGSQACPVPV